MQVGTSPLQWKYLILPENRDELQERRSRTKVTYIEYRPPQDPHPITIDSADGLRTALAPLICALSETPPLRLFIVEDLSTEIIEQLGSRFDVDPLFWREQIEDNVWHNIRDPWAIAPSLTASSKQRSWFRLRNMRLRYHKTGTSFEKGREEVNKWNILRRPDNDNNHWAHKDEVDRDEKGEIRKDENGKEIGKAVVSIMRTRTTIWIGKDKKSGDGFGTVGIVLVDPTMKEGKPLWHDRTNWLPTIGLGQKIPSLPSSDKSWYQDIVRMTTAYPWSEDQSGHEIGPQALVHPTLYTICAEWLIVCDYVKTRVSQIEWEVELPEVFREKEKNDTRSKSELIADSLKRLHTWRRHIPVFRDMVTEALQQGLPAAARLTSSSVGDEAKAFEDIRPDFDRILDNIKELQDRIDRLTAIVTSEINIEDTKQSIEDNHNLARLTWLATIFIPLSFVSAFFSMNESVSALKYTYGWFFLTAIPFTGLCLAIAQLAGGGKLGQKTMSKEIRHKGSSFYSKVKFK